MNVQICAVAIVSIACANGLFAQGNAQTPALCAISMEAAKSYEDQVGSLSQQMREMEDQNAQTKERIAEMQRQMHSLSQDDQRLSEGFGELEKQFKADSEGWRSQIDRMTDNVRAAIKEAQRQAESSDAQAPETEIYVVQPGVCLSLIANTTFLLTSSRRATI